MKPRLFAVGTFCIQRNGQAKIGALIITAASVDEATGMAYSSIRQDYPAEDGWANHAIAVCEVPKEAVERIYTGEDE